MSQSTYSKPDFNEESTGVLGWDGMMTRKKLFFSFWPKKGKIGWVFRRSGS